MRFPLVQGCDRPLGEGQGIVVDREIADGDVAGAGNVQGLAPRGVDQLRAIAIELETVEVLEGEGALDPVARALLAIEDGMNRAPPLLAPGAQPLNLRNCLGEGGIRIDAGAGKTLDVQDGCAEG